ncbi:MAG TPA: PAS domain S-box protein [Burkholderiaceae bacterium]|nr:PAS domain S-box protein [Burkholderiaceae bacterium]
MSLHRFLTRLIWLCILPLVLLAAYLAIDSVRTTQMERDIKAANLAQNFATAIDQDLNARIGALHMLAMSPLADHASRWNEFYQEAQGFRQSFGSHVIFADLEMHMLFNTRVPFGTILPMLPRPKGHAAVPTAMATGKPAVGDIFPGPIAREPLVAIAVPAQREGKTAFLLLTIFETRQFQDRLDRVILPSGWSLALLDSKGAAIARRMPSGQNPAVDDATAARFVARSTVSPWSVALEIPHDVYRAPLVKAAVALAAALLGVTLTGALGGMLASRRLGRSVGLLADVPDPTVPAPYITEIAAVRRLLDESAERHEAAEAARHESEQRFRATFESAAVGLALIAPDGRWLLANQKLCDIVAYDRDELLTRTFQDITHPDDLDADLACVRQMLAGEIGTYSMERRYLSKGGAIVWINLTVALVRHPDGSPDYFIAVIENIQRRKEAEAALQAREATLKEAQRLAGIGNWSWDLRSDRHAWSEEIYRIYGRDPSLPPAVYPEVQKYFTPDSWACLAAAVETCLAQGAPYEFDAEVVRADGARRWITARGEATHDSDGTVMELHGTVQDITERKQAAKALLELNANLEQRVVLRTAELTAANQELDSFAYAVSHDLRAPLRAMSGFSRALIEDYGDRLEGEAKNDLDQIDIASRKMADLIDGILALSRCTRGDLRHDVVDLSVLAATLVAALARTEPGREVSTDIEPGLKVCGDARMIEAVMRNLLGNAWKYTARTPAAVIRVYSGEVDGQPGICVADNGAGFDMAHAERLFQPFQRLHRQDEFPGLGIGLATVQRIVRRHGGEIHAVAAPGAGATVCFSLPQVTAVMEDHHE